MPTYFTETFSIQLFVLPFNSEGNTVTVLMAGEARLNQDILWDLDAGYRIHLLAVLFLQPRWGCGLPGISGQHRNNANNYYWGGGKKTAPVDPQVAFLPVPNAGRHGLHFDGSVHGGRRRRLVGPDQHALLGSVQQLRHLAVGQRRQGIRPIDVVHVCLRSVGKQGEMTQRHLSQE